MSSGLAAVFIEAPEKMQEQNTSVPQVLLDHCKYWNMATSGNVVGKMSVTDLKGQPLGPFPLVMVGHRYDVTRLERIRANEQGWTPKAIGALAGCILTALLGIATIVFYASNAVSEKELEEEMKYRASGARVKTPAWKKLGLGKLIR